MSALGPFEPAPVLGVAVSGGGDSLALLLLADAWARARGGRVVAFTVDHRLRPESAKEAAQTAAWAAARGIMHRTLLWQGEKPKTRVMEKARAARLALLETACADAGILHLLLAHHADDQAETIALRAEDKSGPHGLAGMTEQRFTRHVRLLRPLLVFAKARLLATCRARNQKWIEDASNRDLRFARARLRAVNESPPRADGGLTSPSGAEAAARTRLETAAAKRAAAAVAFHPLGFAAIDRVSLGETEPAVLAVVVAGVVQAVGGGSFPLPPSLREELAAWLRTGQWRGKAVRRCTAGRCLLLRKRDTVLIVREARHLPPPVALAPGVETVWDRRVAVTAAEPGWTLGAPCPEGRGGQSRVRGLETPAVPVEARAGLPVLRAADGRCFPAFRPFAGCTVSAPSESLKHHQIQFIPPRPGFPAAFTVVWPGRRIMF